MVEIARYGPILDPAIEVVKELTQHGEANIYVPLHEEAAGMAVDISGLLIRLYPYIESEIYVPGRMPIPVHGNQDPKARQFRIRYIFNKGLFEVPETEEFHNYPYNTIIDLEDGRQQVDYDTQVAFNAYNTPERYVMRQRNPFIPTLRNNGIKLPEERQRITISCQYQSISSFPVSTFFQQFAHVEEFTRKQVTIGGYHYPVSSKDRHEVDRLSWEYFAFPVFWDSWSQYYTIAFNKMAGRTSYEEAAKRYSTDLAHILRHSLTAEPRVIDILQALKEGRNLSEVADKVKCPYEYRGLYLVKILRSIVWICNPDSLKDPQKIKYLRSLANSCTSCGFHTTPEELARI